MNHLINESSPYLLQHAENPVDWYPWNDAVLQQARENDQLLLISIGYSACHWCHVMAHESFEDAATAQLMNAHFVNIKIDREERPDVDQIYMNALQLMTGRGGWPLNIIALPDGRPVWGGTYLRKTQWNGVLHQLADLYQSEPEKMRDYAEKLTKGLREMEMLVQKEKSELDSKLFEKALSNWRARFDLKMGGTQQVPKFMMPNNYHFLLRYAFQTNDAALQDFVLFTLDKISFGGVFDHLGGGFSRYSTDAKWHVPHFEKMLYDNAQLVSLYCDAFLATQNPWYQKVVFKTLDFIKRELTAENGAFFSALDADSKDENRTMQEGAHYVWTLEEVRSILKEDYELFAEYYNLNDYGRWEANNYVLIRKETDAVLAQQFSLSEKELGEKIAACEKKLFQKRALRNSPGLDDKNLTSWNALMLKAYADAFRVFQEEEFLEAALKNATFLLDHQQKSDDSLFRTHKNGQSTINAYLEDYAFTIEAFLALYENTFNEQWLHRADRLAQVVFEDFFDPDKNMFFFTSKKDRSLIARTIEYQDNVLPSSNSVMAKNLFLLAHYFEKEQYRTTSEQLLKNMQPQMENHPEAYSNWLDLLLNFTQDFYEVVLVGKKALEKSKELNQHYLPQKLIAGSLEKSSMPLLENRYKENETWIYTCVENTCQKPVSSTEAVLEQII